MRLLSCLVVLSSLVLVSHAELNQPPEGFTALFNGKDLSGWWGEKTTNPEKYMSMDEATFAAYRNKSLEDINKHWSVKDGILINDGKGLYLTTDKYYRDFELHLEYKTVARADSGIYLRGVPQVQIWDYTDQGKFKLGADKGSGGLWNNKKNPQGKDPLVLADKPFGEWNAFRISMIGERVTIYLNNKLVVDHARMDNYYKGKGAGPMPVEGPIQLQTHGGEIQWRNVFVREISPEEAAKTLSSKGGDGFESIYDGSSLKGWKGAVDNYEIVDGAIRCKKGKGGTLFTEGVYGDFVARMEVSIPPGGNNGLAIRYPGSGNPAYAGMTELQVLDSEAPKYAKLDKRQYHGSAYGISAAHRGYLREPNVWNFQEVTVKGSHITVELNGTVILDADVSKVSDFMGNGKHPGLSLKQGHFGFAGHSDPVSFRNLSIKKL